MEIEKIEQGINEIKNNQGIMVTRLDSIDDHLNKLNGTVISNCAKLAELDKQEALNKAQLFHQSKTIERNYNELKETQALHIQELKKADETLIQKQDNQSKIKMSEMIRKNKDLIVVVLFLVGVLMDFLLLTKGVP